MCCCLSGLAQGGPELAHTCRWLKLHCQQCCQCWQCVTHALEAALHVGLDCTIDSILHACAALLLPSLLACADRAQFKQTQVVAARQWPLPSMEQEHCCQITILQFLEGVGMGLTLTAGIRVLELSLLTQGLAHAWLCQQPLACRLNLPAATEKKGPQTLTCPCPGGPPIGTDTPVVLHLPSSTRRPCRFALVQHQAQVGAER